MVLIRSNTKSNILNYFYFFKKFYKVIIKKNCLLTEAVFLAAVSIQSMRIFYGILKSAFFVLPLRY